MRVFACVLAISLSLAGAAEAAPKRVASLNMCTDELLLALAAPGQIASVTHLSHIPAESRQWKAARRYKANDGSLISVVPMRPDLVLTMGGGAGDKMGIAKRLGLRVVDLPYPQSIADIEAGIRTVAAALGRTDAARPSLRAIAALKAAQPRRPLDAIWLGGGGRSIAADGPGAQWMRLAGLRQRAIRGDRVSLEQLLLAPPAVLLRSDYRSDQYSSEQRWLAHPLAKGVGKVRTLPTDGRAWTCMGPEIIGEILRLRREVTK